MSTWRIRPSAASRIVACPGTIRVCADAPAWMDEDGDNTVREEGTACHWVAFEAARGNMPAIGTLAPNAVPVDRGMHDAANLYIATVNRWQTPTVWFERPLPVPQVPECGGTPDVFSIDHKRKIIYIADLKYGYRIVEVFPNYQLILYALAVIAFFYLSDLTGWQIHFTIVQPRRWHVQGPVRTYIATWPELAPIVETMRQKLALALLPDAPLVPGKHCEWCPGRARCNALRQTVLDEFVCDPHDLPFDAAERELQFLQSRLETLEAYISGLAAQVEHGLRNGENSERFEMARTTGRRVWKSAEDEQAARNIAKLMGVNIEKTPELITPTQAMEKMPPEIVNMFAHREPGAVKLIPLDHAKWVARFGEKPQ